MSQPPDLSKLKASLPPGVAEALSPQRIQVPVVRHTNLVGNLTCEPDPRGDPDIRAICCYHGLPQGSEVTQFRVPLAALPGLARGILKGTGYVVVHDPAAEADQAAADAHTEDQASD